MEFIIAESTEDMSRQAADRIASYVDADPSCVLGLATGTTPIGLYAVPRGGLCAPAGSASPT